MVSVGQTNIVFVSCILTLVILWTASVCSNVADCYLVSQCFYVLCPVWTLFYCWAIRSHDRQFEINAYLQVLTLLTSNPYRD